MDSSKGSKETRAGTRSNPSRTNVSNVDSVDWQCQCADANQRIAHLYKLGEWTDCSFKLGREIVKAHKLVLAMSSPVFAAMFYGAMAEKSETIEIVDVDPNAFKVMLEYIYTNKINVSLDSAFSLYYVAKKYILPNLITECVRAFCANLSIKNVCQVYEIPGLEDEKLLNDACIQLLSSKTLEVVKSASFVTARIDIVNKILDLDSLNIDNEMDIYEALIKYSSATKIKRVMNIKNVQGTSQDIFSKSLWAEVDEIILNEPSLKEPSQNLNKGKSEASGSQPKTVKRRKTSNATEKPDETVSPNIREMVKKLRFLSLTPNEFASCKYLNTLLTQEEIFALSMNIASRSTNIPMPLGFSTNDTPRNKLFRDGEVTKVIYRSVVRNVKKLHEKNEQYRSKEFYARDIPWFITIHSTEHENDLGVFITCNVQSAKSWSCHVQYEIRLISYNSGMHHLFHKTEQRFTDKDNDWGCSFLWRDVLDPYKCYMKDDQMTYEVHIMPNKLCDYYLPPVRGRLASC